MAEKWTTTIITAVVIEQIKLIDLGSSKRVEHDKGYAVWVVKDFDPLANVTRYRTYSKGGSRTDNPWRIYDGQTCKTEQDALAVLRKTISTKLAQGYKLVGDPHKIMLGYTQIPVEPPPLGQYDPSKINPIILNAGEKDDKNGPFLGDHADAGLTKFEDRKNQGVTGGSTSTSGLPTPPSMPTVLPPSVDPDPRTPEDKEMDRLLKGNVIPPYMKKYADESPFLDETHPAFALIPSDKKPYLWSPGEMEELTYLWKKNKRVLFVGVHGCGKSFKVKNFAAHVKRPFRRFNLNGHTTSSEIIGKNKVIPGSGMVWQDGILPRAMKEGWILLVDEVDFADPAVLALFHPVLEPDGELVLKENDGEIITPHPEFRLFATANSLGMHDPNGDYNGTNVMNAAFMDRWEVVRQDYPSRDIEKYLMLLLGHKVRTADLLVSLSDAVRTLTKTEQMRGFSTRRLESFAEAYLSLKDWRRAYRLSVAGQYSVDENEALLKVFQKHLGGTAA